MSERQASYQTAPAFAHLLPLNALALKLAFADLTAEQLDWYATPEQEIHDYAHESELPVQSIYDDAGDFIGAIVNCFERGVEAFDADAALLGLFADRAAAKGALSAPCPGTQGIPFVITQKMKTDLKARGQTPEQIHDMTPAQAHEILGTYPPTTPPEDQPQSGRPTALKPRLESIPHELTALPNWVLWRYEPPKKPGGKWAKVPYQPNGYRASTTNRRNWSTFKRCRAIYEQGGYDGVGFVFDGAVGPDGTCLAGIDLDRCLPPANRKIQHIAVERIKRFGTYTEASPSGTGLHMIARTEPVASVKTEEGEVYTRARYFTFTGRRWGEESPIRTATAEVRALVAELRAKQAAGGQSKLTAAPGNGAAPQFKIADAFVHLDPKHGLVDDLPQANHWFDRLQPEHKDQVVDHALGTIIASLEKNGGHTNELWYRLTTSVARSGAPNAETIFIKHASSTKNPEPEDALREIFARCQKDPPDGCRGYTVGTLLALAQDHSADFEPWRQLALRAPTPAEGKLFQTSAEFVAGYVPPDYLIDGLLQRRYVYSFTAKTGDGKTTIALLLAAYVAMGRALAGREVERGRVLFFAGENPDDVRSRWIMLCEALGEDPDQMDVVFMPFTLNLSAEEIRARIDAEAAKAGPFSLLIVDTSASYYSGDDENDNVALGNHARMLRTFVNLPGGPTILVTCHPIKTPDMTNLLPRGGGAFLAEVDGNLVCIKDAATMLVEVTWHGKFRGPDFTPFSFKLLPATSRKLVDSKGRSVWSIYARTVSDAEQKTLTDAGRVEQSLVLQVMRDYPSYSLTEIAKHLGWLTASGEPSKQKVHRLMAKLQKAKLVELGFGEGYKLTGKGQKVAKDMPKLADGPTQK